MSEDQELTPRQLEQEQLKQARNKAAKELKDQREKYKASVKTEPVAGTMSAEQYEAEMNKPAGVYLGELNNKASQLRERIGYSGIVKIDGSKGVSLKTADGISTNQGESYTFINRPNETCAIVISPSATEKKVQILDYPSEKNGLKRYAWRKEVKVGKTKGETLENIPELIDFDKLLDKALEQTSDSSK